MLDVRDLALPVLGAPMAGGPSSPALAAAVSNAGGLGMLAGGSIPAESLHEAMRMTRVLLGLERPVAVDAGADEGADDGAAPDAVGEADARSAMHDPIAQEPAPYGVNLFVPRRANTAEEDLVDLDAHASAVEAYAATVAAAIGVERAELGHPDPLDDDEWERKLDLLEAEPVALVSFTFGLPHASVFDRLHAVGSACGVMVTGARDALEAVEAGADLVIAQGVEAGGHRSTWRVVDEPNGDDTLTVVRGVREALESLERVDAEDAASLGTEAEEAEAGHRPVAIVAAGGVDGPERVQAVRDAGADAVQVGTALLLAEEAGTKPTVRAALVDPALDETVVTRAFSGRAARALRTRFAVEFDAVAPAAYPDVNQLTAPLRARAEAAGDVHGVSAYAGVRWRSARAEPVARILEHLLLRG